MGVFSNVTLGWNGKDYVIPADRVLGLIAEVEEIITLKEVAAFHQRGTAPMARLARAYSAALRYAGAGAEVTDEAVYQGMFAAEDQDSAVAVSIAALLQMMMPPATFARKVASQGNGQGAGALSSKSATRPSSPKRKR